MQSNTYIKATYIYLIKHEKKTGTTTNWDAYNYTIQMQQNETKQIKRKST